VTDAVLHDRAAQHDRDVVLHQQIGKALGAVLPGESQSHGRKLAGGTAGRQDGETEKEMPQATRSDLGHRLALLPARS